MSFDQNSLKVGSREAFDAAFAAAVESYTPVAVWSEPGTGKTSSITSLAERLGIEIFVVDLTTISETADLAGYPIGNDGETVKMLARKWAHDISQSDEPVILLLDEIGSCDPAVAAACMSVVNDRRVGEVELGDNVITVLAGNPPENAANAYEIPAPLANRMMHLHFTPLSAEGWAIGLMNGWDMVTSTADLGHNPSQEKRDAAKALVGGFVCHKPEFLQDCPEDPSAQSKPWPSQRSWHVFTNVLAYLPSGDLEALSLACSGLVGQQAAADFMTWVEYGDLHTPRELLDDPELLDWNDRADRIHTMLLSTASYARRTGSEADFKKAWKLLGGAEKHGKLDVAGSAAYVLQDMLSQNEWKVPKEAKMFTAAFQSAGLIAAA